MINILILLFTVALIGGVYFFKKFRHSAKTPQPSPKKEVKTEVKETKPKSTETTQSTQPSNKNLKRQEADQKKKIRKTNPTHPSFLRGFKGFKDRIADFDVSSDGMCVVACSPDNTFRVYRPKDLNDQEPLMIYQKIDFYEPTSISLKNDKKLVAIGMGENKMVEFYSLNETAPDDEGKTKIKIEFFSRSADKLHKTPLKHLFLDYDGKFYITGSDEDDTSVKAWTLGGELIGNVTTAQMKNHHIARSEDGRFLGVGAWTSDVTILEIKTNKDGSLKSLSKAMALKGHRQGIIDLAFNNLNDKAITLSKDGTMKLWNINVRYEVSEDPKCLATVVLNEHEELKNLSGSIRVGVYTFAEEDRSIGVITNQNNIVVFDFKKNKVAENIVQAHSEGSSIFKLAFKEHSGKPYLYSSGEDGRINMWNFSNL